MYFTIISELSKLQIYNQTLKCIIHFNFTYVLYLIMILYNIVFYIIYLIALYYRNLDKN